MPKPNSKKKESVSANSKEDDLPSNILENIHLETKSIKNEIEKLASNIIYSGIEVK